MHILDTAARKPMHVPYYYYLVIPTTTTTTVVFADIVFLRLSLALTTHNRLEFLVFITFIWLLASEHFLDLLAFVSTSQATS